MLAVAGDPPPRSAWTEWKFDGHRTRADTGLVNGPRLVSRGGHIVTHRFPEIVDALVDVVGTRMAVLDGELVVPGAGGLPDFDRLQRRSRVTPTRNRVALDPVTLVCFDLLALGGIDLTRRPLRERRALLDELIPEGHPRLMRSPVFRDVDPAVLLDAARAHGMEGVVTKRPTSTYTLGARSKSWVKTVITERAEFLIAGSAQGRARRPGAFGSLLLGTPTPAGGLEFVGEVGTGWSRSEHARLSRLLAELSVDECPFTKGADRVPVGARFTHPVLRCLVAYREHRPGALLRHPSWKGLV